MSGLGSGRVGGLFGIVRRSLRQHALSTAITVLSLALACGLVLAVFNIQHQAKRAFTGGETGFDAVLGARGSALQLVLNTVFHLETSPGNIPYTSYLELAADPRIELAIPYAVGDQYEGFRVVGTTPDIFERFEYRRGEKLIVREGGRAFDPEAREAVIGSFVARRTGLRPGDEFHPSHSIGESVDEHHHDEEYLVVGVLEPTNSPSDRVVWIPIDGMFHMEGHYMRGEDGQRYQPDHDEEIPDEHKEISAVMLKLKTPQAGFSLAGKYNLEEGSATFAFPIAGVMLQLFDKLGWMTRVLELVAYLVVVVAAGSVLASIYNTMNERRREFAILRALGAERRTVFTVIVLESGTIALLGALVGLVVYGAILWVAAAIVREQTGVVLDMAEVHDSLFVAPIAITALGALTGVVPALKAYRTDVATHLLPVS